MPTYEYVCDACESRFERFQKISDPPVKKCPACGAREARRIISPGAGLLFKGPGFYATDYRKDASRPGKAKDGSEDKAEGKAEGKKSGDAGGPGGKEDG